jgi:ParB family chromosome partitioning protein
MQECGLTQEMVATKVGKSRPAVANFLRLLKLPPEAQAAVRDEALSMGHARALLPVTSAEDQRAFLQKAIAESWSVRQLEEAIRRYLADPAPAGPVAQAATTPPSRAELELRAITDALRTALATQVRVKHTASEGKGRIEIDYYSEEDLQRLIDLLVR